MFFSNSDSSETLPQHRPIPLEFSCQIQLDTTIGFGVMLNNVKLDNRKFTPKSESNLT